MKRINQFLATVAGGVLCVGLVGCDVDVRDPGQMPDVEVRDGEMPDVDVRGPDVQTGEKEVTVPTIDIDVPEENETNPNDE